MVHRRSHTGEKPFKCPECPHACTQQSKLKRHMKTHSTKSQNVDGKTSPGGTPIDLKEEMDDIEDEEEEEEEVDELEGEDEEEEEDEEDIVEEEMNEEERQVLETMRKDEANRMSQNHQDSEPGEIRHEEKRGIKREHSNDKSVDVDDNCEPSDLSMKKPRQPESLLSEVIKNSGLNCIPSFSEAYKAALAESQGHDMQREVNDLSVKSEAKNGGENVQRSFTPKSPKTEKELDKKSDTVEANGQQHSFFGGKHGKNSVPPAAIWNANPIESAASMYSRLQHSWFHPDSRVRLLFQQGYPPQLPSPRDLSLSRENHGLNLSPNTTNTSSALSSTSPNMPGGMFHKSSGGGGNSRGSSSAGNSPTTSLLPTNGGGGGVINPLKKDHRRNDTCEYCGKIFKNCSNLTVHRRSHTGEKPYKCSLCSYACAQSSKLTRHMKTHGRIGKDVYSCKFCNMPFSVASTLEKHMRKCVDSRQSRILADGNTDIGSDTSNGDMPENYAQSHVSV